MLELVKQLFQEIKKYWTSIRSYLELMKIQFASHQKIPTDDIIDTFKKLLL